VFVKSSQEAFIFFYPTPLYEETVQKDMDELSLEMQMYFK